MTSKKRSIRTPRKRKGATTAAYLSGSKNTKQAQLSTVSGETPPIKRLWFDRVLDMLKIGIGLANLILGISKH